MLRSALAVVALTALFAAPGTTSPSPSSAEYARHFGALSKLSIAVAQTMPADHYNFRPHPESMDFGQLMVHIASTNFQFCAGLRDSAPPKFSSPNGKDAVINFLTASFDYCTEVIPKLTEAQLQAAHDSPDGHMPGRDILLAMYIHVAHHRGQAEIYLRDEGIRPPGYMI